MFRLLKESGRIIMTLGLIGFVSMVILAIQDTTFNMFQSVPLLLSMIVYVVGRVLVQLQINDKRRAKKASNKIDIQL